MSGSKTTPNSSDTIQRIINFGKTIIPGFTVFDGQEEIYFQLNEYFNGKGDLDLKKGILLSGSIGSGKTTAMRLFEKATKRFRIISTRHIVRDTQINGFETIDKYGRSSFGTVYTPEGEGHPNKPISYCFDDLGLEDVNTKFYGNASNPIAEILLDRYECQIKYGMKTFATTNISIENLEQIYGDRLRDRFKEMFNLLYMKGKSLRS